MGGGEGDGGEIGTLNLDYADWMDYADGFRVIPAKSIVADACGNPVPALSLSKGSDLIRIS